MTDRASLAILPDASSKGVFFDNAPTRLGALSFTSLDLLPTTYILSICLGMYLIPTVDVLSLRSRSSTYLSLLHAAVSFTISPAIRPYSSHRQQLMPQQILRDRQGRRIGSITTSANGKQIAHDATGRKVGEYDPKSNVTRNASGTRVGEGNLLAGLIR